MTIAKASDLVKWAKYALDNGFGYVYGGQGELYSKAQAEKWIKAKRPIPDSTTREKYFLNRCSRWFGKYVVDCSGMIVWAIQKITPSYKDRTANGFKSQFTKSGPMSTMPEVPGIAVWSDKHIGIYIGGGYVIEARGTDIGVAKTQIKNRNWQRWGYIKDVDYGDSIKEEPGFKDVVCVTKYGGTVNIRKAPAMSSDILGKVVTGQKFKAKPPAGDWCEVMVGNIKGYMHKDYIKF